MQFSPTVIAEYQVEMASTYGTAVCVEEAQIQLHSLVRCLFGSSTAAAGSGAGFKPRRAGAWAGEVGDSITPTSGHLDK